ncbi:MAG: sce7725 family protein [Bacteroidales bacterium]
MYYPYLRGRQFELIALREYAQQKGDNNNIIPIIEPVKVTFNSMKLALPQLIAGNVKFALILNPQVGDIKNYTTITEPLFNELSNKSNWIPAFIITKNYQEVSTIILENNYNEVMLVLTDMVDIENRNFIFLAESLSVKYIVTKENKSLKRKVKNKEFIRLDDNFKRQKRNSDYLAIDEEKFTEEHLFYVEDVYSGFSDYTTLVSDYIEGGISPWAIAIHLTYTKDNKEIWVKHFVSDTNDDQSNIQGKFSQAARKAVEFLDYKNIHTQAADELRNYFREQRYPGLGMIKKISIKHHLELVNGLLPIT